MKQVFAWSLKTKKKDIWIPVRCNKQRSHCEFIGVLQFCGNAPQYENWRRAKTCKWGESEVQKRPATCEVRYSALQNGFAHWYIVKPIGKGGGGEKKVIHSKQISCLLLFGLAQLQAGKCFHICYHANHMHARGCHAESEGARICLCMRRLPIGERLTV